MKYDGKQLIAFFKGTAGEFNRLHGLAPMIMSAAADMRNTVSPYRVTDFQL